MGAQAVSPVPMSTLVMEEEVLKPMTGSTIGKAEMLK